MVPEGAAARHAVCWSMRGSRWIGLAWLLAAGAAAGDATTPPPPEKGASVRETREEALLEMAIEMIDRFASYSGAAIVVDRDPRFVLVGHVRSIDRAGFFAPGSRQVFAVHSPARLGIPNWTKTDPVPVGERTRWDLVLRFVVRRFRAGDRTRWELVPAKPD
jgi:hypothetical protein